MKQFINQVALNLVTDTFEEFYNSLEAFGNETMHSSDTFRVENGNTTLLMFKTNRETIDPTETQLLEIAKTIHNAGLKKNRVLNAGNLSKSVLALMTKTSDVQTWDELNQEARDVRLAQAYALWAAFVIVPRVAPVVEVLEIEAGVSNGA